MIDGKEIVFGWGAPPIKDQHPLIPQTEADHFDKDNQAIIRCHLRGLISDHQRNSAFAKLTKKIAGVIRAEVEKQASVQLSGVDHNAS